MRAVVLAVLILLASVAEAYRAGDGVCADPFGYYGRYIQNADTSSCTATSCESGDNTYLAWTRQRLANCDNCLVSIGSDEQSLNVTSSPVIPEEQSTTFTLHWSGITDGYANFSTTNITTWMDSIRALVPAGHDGPIFVYAMRWDLLSRHELAMTSTDLTPAASWFLRTDRVHANFADWFHGAGAGAAGDSRCDLVAGGANDGLACGWSLNRNPTTVTSLTAGEIWDTTVPASSGINRVFPIGEYNARLYDLIDDVQAGLADDAVYYINISNAGTAKVWIATAALADMLDNSYQAAAVAKCSAAMAAGYDGCEFPHKHDHFWNQNTGLAVSYWLNVGDGLSGLSGAVSGGCTPTGTLDTITELESCGSGVSSGPPERASGTMWEWEEYALAQAELMRLNNAASNKTVRIVTAALYRGCEWGPSHSNAKMGATYDHATCDNDWDDTGTSALEDAYLREIVQRQEWVYIDLGGKALTSSSIGAGAGSGFSYEDLKWVIENPESGVPAPKVMGWLNSDAPNTVGQAPILCADTSETNPETALTTVVVACNDGIDNDGDGLTDFSGSDPGCAAAKDASERGTAQCDDNADNDADGDTDINEDGQCSSASDNNEAA